ncbi:UPF0262 family protein [Emcibacter sp. SYSU 3D8]|uniref:UPF0262 family protein n=1 Tax=Emcibacter sp. SYSU 3D8 TaxID=3133969 RepID=UPI0031FF21DB
MPGDIIRIRLDEKSIVRRNADIEHERKVAIFDLLEDNCFGLKSVPGPYDLVLRLEESRLIVEVRDDGANPLEEIRLQVSPFRRIIKDYFMVCESYFSAIKTSSPSQIEAIDMGRRGLHNEGSEMLRERLAQQVDMDLATARRLFTLICVLHIRG